MRRPSLARKPAWYSTLTLGASTPTTLVHGHGAVSDSGAVRAQTKAGLRSLRPGIHLPAVDPTWMQPRRSAAHRPRIRRKQLVDVEWREDRQKQVRDALRQLLRLGDHAHGCCIPPHEGAWWPLSGSSAIASPFRSRLKNRHAISPQFQCTVPGPT